VRGIELLPQAVWPRQPVQGELLNHRNANKHGTHRSAQEANANEITLVDDDPDALQAALAYLYSFKYKIPASIQAASSERAVTAFHLKVYTVADKYGLESLTREAHGRIRDSRDRVLDAGMAMGWLEIVGESNVDHHLVRHWTCLVARDFLVTLRQDPAFLKWIGTRPDFLKKLLEGLEKFDAMEEYYLIRCKDCSRDYPIDDEVEIIRCIGCGRLLNKNWHGRPYYT